MKRSPRGTLRITRGRRGGQRGELGHVRCHRKRSRWVTKEVTEGRLGLPFPRGGGSGGAATRQGCPSARGARPSPGAARPPATGRSDRCPDLGRATRSAPAPPHAAGRCRRRRTGVFAIRARPIGSQAEILTACGTTGILENPEKERDQAVGHERLRSGWNEK